jgi:hypothetical protein
VPLPPYDRAPAKRSTAPPAPPSQPPAAPAVSPVAAPSPPAAAPAPAELPGAATPPAGTPPPAAGSPLRQLHRRAAETYAGIDSYIARLTRRERVRGKDKPEEVMLFKFRKEPWSVHFKWLSGDGQGREVVYVKGRYEDKLHSLLAAGDFPLAPAGKRIALPIDSVFVRNASRHSITEAGIGSSIERFGALVEAQERGDRRQGTLTYLGPQPRPEFACPMVAVEWAVPPGREDDLPHGGRRVYHFDQQTGLPLLIVTRDDKGREVEYYRYDRLQYPVRLDDADFNPDQLWGRVAGSERGGR